MLQFVYYPSVYFHVDDLATLVVDFDEDLDRRLFSLLLLLPLLVLLILLLLRTFILANPLLLYLCDVGDLNVCSFTDPVI